DTSRRERLPRRPHRAAESDDTVPSNGAVRLAAQAAGERSRGSRVGRLQVVLSCGRTPKGSVMKLRPVEARRPDPPESKAGYSAPSVEPLAGVSSPVITAAARRVAQRIRDEGIDAADMDIVAAVVAAIALAVDQERPRYVTELVHRASPALGTRLLELLRTEVISGWSTGADHL